MMIIGVKESTAINKILTFIKLLILLFVIICGATKANFNNWIINTNVNKLFVLTINKFIFIVSFFNN
jgi:amino acid transporter